MNEAVAAHRFPALRRGKLETLQLNLGYRCNQACAHCHVDAGPARTEAMSEATAALALEFARAAGVKVFDLTGGAPELSPVFRGLVAEACAAGIQVIDRCNLTILEEPGQEDLAEFLAAHRVRVVASLPCYGPDNVDAQRGKGVFEKSIRGLKRLNALGYGLDGGDLVLDLVYNPLGAHLPPPQATLEATYKRELAALGVRFNHLLTLANMPIARFRHALEREGRYHDYLSLLIANHRNENLGAVMCRSLLSVDWQGNVHDCDFNQMLGMPLGAAKSDVALASLLPAALDGMPIAVGPHCFGCTAGAGSSCGGALTGT